MAGILDSKSRVIDTFVTEEGRYRILKGLNVKYISFSDDTVSYKGVSTDDDDIDVSKILFEAVSSQHDTLLPNTEVLVQGQDKDVNDFFYNNSRDKLFDKIGYSVFDSTGSLVQFQTIINANSASLPGNAGKSSIPAGKSFDDYVTNFFSNIFKEYSKTNSLYTVKETIEEEQIILNKNKIEFKVPTSVINANSSATIEQYKNEIYQHDQRINKFSTALKNKYLPPVFFGTNQLVEELPIETLTQTDIINDLFFYDNNEDVIRFRETSDLNNSLMQMYEIDRKNKRIEKLRLVETDENTITIRKNGQVIKYKIIMCGKIVQNRFFNIFSIVLYGISG
jgi:hypothetical protein